MGGKAEITCRDRAGRQLKFIVSEYECHPALATQYGRVPPCITHFTLLDGRSYVWVNPSIPWEAFFGGIKAAVGWLGAVFGSSTSSRIKDGIKASAQTGEVIMKLKRSREGVRKSAYYRMDPDSGTIDHNDCIDIDLIYTN